MDKTIGFFYKVKGSIADIGFYREVIRESKGKAFTYLLLLSLLVSSLVGLRFLYSFNTGLNTVISQFAKDTPDFVLRNGELDVYENMPYELYRAGGEIYIIDTSGQLTEEVLDEYYQGMLITRYGIIHKENPLQTKYIDFEGVRGITITKNDVMRLLPLLRWLNLFIIVFGFAFYFLGKIISAFIISIIGAIVNTVKSYNISYSDIYKISIYALTLPIIMKGIRSLTGIYIPYFRILYYGVAIFYVIRAMSIINTEESV